MNRKKLNIVLISCATILWVLVIIKAFSFSKTPKTDELEYPNEISFQDSIIVRDTITIYANYRDPFKEAPFNSATVSTPKSHLKPIPNSAKPIAEWPNISYGGLVKTTKNDRELALITIADHTIIAEKNNRTSDIKILSISPDSIIVQFQKEKKTIVKE